MNIISFDIEEWYLENKLHGGRTEKYRQFDEMLDRVLKGLDDNGIKGTFFCLGKMATDYPHVVKKIASLGHEIGCHSDSHQFLTSFTPIVLKQDTRDALYALEDVIGAPVTSYRAPAFSITPDNAWAIEVLAECGLKNDASIFPANRDYGGYPGFPKDMPCRISYRGSVLKEYPVTIMSMMGKHIAFSGGGYFRALPYRIVRNEVRRRSYNICYFHLADLIPEQKKMLSRVQHEAYFKEPGTIMNRLKRFAKNNIGSGDAYGKLVRLMNDFSFSTIRDVDVSIDWSNTTLIDLSR